MNNFSFVVALAMLLLLQPTQQLLSPKAIIFVDNGNVKNLALSPDESIFIPVLSTVGNLKAYKISDGTLVYDFKVSSKSVAGVLWVNQIAGPILVLGNGTVILYSLTWQVLLNADTGIPPYFVAAIKTGTNNALLAINDINAVSFLNITYTSGLALHTPIAKVKAFSTFQEMAFTSNAGEIYLFVVDGLYLIQTTNLTVYHCEGAFDIHGTYPIDGLDKLSGSKNGKVVGRGPLPGFLVEIWDISGQKSINNGTNPSSTVNFYSDDYVLGIDIIQSSLKAYSTASWSKDDEISGFKCLVNTIVSNYGGMVLAGDDCGYVWVMDPSGSGGSSTVVIVVVVVVVLLVVAGIAGGVVFYLKKKKASGGYAQMNN